MPRCPIHNTKFKQKYIGQKHCRSNDECQTAESKLIAERFRKKSERERRQKLSKEKQDWKAEKKRLKERLKTHKDYLREAQEKFNEYIRLRDKDKGCISCTKPFTQKYDAGHFYSVGGNPSIRLNEDNAHGQCVYCNRDKHGNLLEYADRLPQRIGTEALEKLKEARHIKRKYSIQELIEIKERYKNKIKEHGKIND